MKTDLDKLIEAVEAGALPHYLPFPAPQDALIIVAFNGSLDAAKALHDALLGDGNISTPGYMATVYMSGKATVWDVISGNSGHGEVSAIHLHYLSPARAWLIAILKAYRSMNND